MSSMTPSPFRESVIAVYPGQDIQTQINNSKYKQIYLTPGDHYISSPLEITREVQIFGEGANTKLLWSGSTSDPMIYTHDTDRVTLRNFELKNGTTIPDQGIFIKDASSSRILDMILTNTGNVGIAIDGTDQNKTYNTIIYDVDIWSADDYGIWLYSSVPGSYTTPNMTRIICGRIRKCNYGFYADRVSTSLLLGVTFNNNNIAAIREKGRRVWYVACRQEVGPVSFLFEPDSDRAEIISGWYEAAYTDNSTQSNFKIDGGILGGKHTYTYPGIVESRGAVSTPVYPGLTYPGFNIKSRSFGVDDYSIISYNTQAKEVALVNNVHGDDIWYVPSERSFVVDTGLNLKTTVITLSGDHVFTGDHLSCLAADPNGANRNILPTNPTYSGTQLWITNIGSANNLNLSTVNGTVSVGPGESKIFVYIVGYGWYQTGID